MLVYLSQRGWKVANFRNDRELYIPRLCNSKVSINRQHAIRHRWLRKSTSHQQWELQAFQTQMANLQVELLEIVTQTRSSKDRPGLSAKERAHTALETIMILVAETRQEQTYLRPSLAWTPTPKVATSTHKG